MQMRTILIIALSTAALACGPGDNNGSDNNGQTNGDTNGQTNGDTNGQTNGDTNNGSNGDTNNGTTSSPVELPDIVALGATADFASGASAWHAISSTDGVLDVVTTDFGSGDVAVSVGNQWAYVLDRNGAQVQVLNRSDLSDAGIVDVSGDAANPQFATDANNKIYVTLYDAGEVVVATPDGGDFTVDRLDLSQFDDADQNPEPSAILADEGYVLVVLQRLENFMGVANSLLLVIDTATDEFVDFDAQTAGVQPLDLGVTNAQANIRRTPSGDIAIGATGMFGANDGGIVIVERDGPGEYSVGETFATEEELGGDLLDFVFTGDGVGFAVISKPDFSTELLNFEQDDPFATSTVDLIADAGFAGLDAFGDTDWWASGDRGDTSGFRFVKYPLNDGAFLPTDLPPAGLVFVDTPE